MTATARSKRAALPELDACVECVRDAAALPVAMPVAAELDAVASRGAEWRDSARLALDERPRRLETLEALAAAAVGLPLKLPYSAELDAARGALQWEERLRLLVPAAAAAAASPAAPASAAGGDPCLPRGSATEGRATGPFAWGYPVQKHCRASSAGMYSS